jgi:hypothetical protein
MFFSGGVCLLQVYDSFIENEADKLVAKAYFKDIASALNDVIVQSPKSTPV